MKGTSLLKFAELYFEKGFKIIPVVFRNKMPMCSNGGSWKNISISSPDQIGDYFNKPSNIGIRLGRISNDLTDVDLDCAESVAIAKNINTLKKGAQFGRKSVGVNHYFFRCEGSKTMKFTDPVNKKTILEIRSDGTQTVVPPSIHKDSGEIIEWYSEIEPPEIKWDQLLRYTKKLAGLTLLARHWPRGQRQESAMALCGWFIRSGLKKKQIEVALRAIVTAARDEESQSRLKVVDHSFKRREKGENFYGYRKCMELFGKEVMQSVSEWLELKQDDERSKKNTRDRIAEKVTQILAQGQGGQVILDDEVLMTDIAGLKNNDLPGFNLIRELFRGRINLNTFDSELKSYLVAEGNEDPPCDNLPLELTDGKPSLCVSEKDLTIQREFCWNVIREQGKEAPKIFLNAGNLSRIKVEKGTAVMIEPLNEHSLVAELSELIYFYNYENRKVKQVYPPTLLVKAMLNENDPPVPEINRISSNPVFAHNGQLLSTKGYHEVAKLWLDRDFSTLNIPDKPTQKDVFGARDYLFEELFEDFPFSDLSGLAYMFAAMLQNYVRGMIVGNTPMFLVDAISREGTGKTLLSTIVAFVGTGKIPNPMTSTTDEDEVRKRITTALMQGNDVILVDNINKKWNSSAFATALTSSMWQDRVLGGNSSVRCKIENLWIGNGNSVEPSRELARRVVLTMLDAKTSMPWTRDTNKFRHPELMIWVEENIDSLIEACLTIVKGWVCAGCPKSSKTLGSYEQWAKVMGGILEFSEIKGFLENLDKIYENMDQFTMSWVEFLPLWWQNHGSDPVGVAELWKLADEHSLLLEVLGEGSERSQKTKLGSSLRDLNGRFLSEWKIEEVTANRGKGGTKKYKLTGGNESHIYKENDPGHFFVENKETTEALDGEDISDAFEEVKLNLDNIDLA